MTVALKIDRSSFNNRFGENSFNRSGYGNPNEYNAEHFENRNGYDRSYNDNELNPWDKPESTNIQPIETFNLFDSAPKYGMHHNLIFSVSMKFIFLDTVVFLTIIVF